MGQKSLHCPHCEAVIDTTDGECMSGHVTYWGEEGPRPKTCQSCNRDFHMMEHVMRWWTVGKTAEEADQ